MTFVKILIRMNVRIYLYQQNYTNEYPNIIILIFFDTNECPNQYSYWKLHEYSNIFEYSSRFYTLTHLPTNVRIYLYKQIWHERMSEYIRKRKIDTNECPNIYSWPIYSNIQIFEYIRHTLVRTIQKLSGQSRNCQDNLKTVRTIWDQDDLVWSDLA